ncbi:nucleoside monophosphate kinase [Micromonospora sp. NPDC003241]
MQAGELVPDEVQAEFVTDILNRSPEGWVLYGCPRTRRHAELLDEHGHTPGIVIEITLDEDAIGQDRRLAETRGQLPQILVEHRRRIAPIRAFYRDANAIHPLQPSRPLEKLAADLKTLVGNPPE